LDKFNFSFSVKVETKEKICFVIWFV